MKNTYSIIRRLVIFVTRHASLPISSDTGGSTVFYDYCKFVKNISKYLYYDCKLLTAFNSGMPYCELVYFLHLQLS